MNDIPTTTASSVNNNHVSTINSTSNGTSSLSVTECTKNKITKQPFSTHGTSLKASIGSGPSSIGKKARKQQHKNPHDGGVSAATLTGNQSPRFNKHRAQGKLTTDNQGPTKSTTANEVENSDAKPTDKAGKRKSNKGRTKKIPLTSASSTDDSMATTMAQELSSSTYECMVCWDVIRRAHHTWTCDTCWAVFHVNCIDKWAKRSLEDTSTNLMITSWRCPGCQHQRKAIPQDYFCFCGKQKNPTPMHYQTPHTCDALCKRPRKCPHPCVLPCHPGPCPPCTSLGPITACYCGKDRRQARCVDTDYTTNAYHCENVCDQRLGCGKHRCEEICHSGLCPPCAVEEKHQSCYCGQSQRNTRCGNGNPVPSNVGGRTGYYACEKQCTNLYECGIHRCDKNCHTCTELTTCPYSPVLVTTCPCGTHTMEDLLHGELRTSCADPIPTCTATCGNVLSCGHTCQQSCHHGPCDPCGEPVKMSCRCNSSERDVICTTTSPPLCDRICKSNRNCGRHVCGTTCCPAAKIHGKKRTTATTSSSSLSKAHDCPLECGRLLSCGKHHCTQTCHKGPCSPCMESTSDDITCHCGRTRLTAPVRCGTTLPSCSNPCLRPSQCGHTRLLHHNCHPDNEPCPPCPVLTSRECVCGKANLKNIPCYRESAYCGLVCDKPLPCGGGHRCKRSCHDGNCLLDGDGCTQPCASIRTSCGHPCLVPCHSGACPETTLCLARIRASCACGQLTMEITCHSSATSSGSNPNLECNDLCTKIQRNQRLASALNIRSPGTSSSPVLDAYDKPLRDFYVENSRWCKDMEAKLIDFVEDDSLTSLHFKPMRPLFRQFLHQYSQYFNLGTEEMDPDPYRSVAVHKSLGKGSVPPTLLSSSRSSPTKLTRNQVVRLSNALQVTSSSSSNVSLDDLLKPLVNTNLPAFTIQGHAKESIVLPHWAPNVDDKTKDATMRQWRKGLLNAFMFNDRVGDEVVCCSVDATGKLLWPEKQSGAWGFDVIKAAP